MDVPRPPAHDPLRARNALRAVRTLRRWPAAYWVATAAAALAAAVLAAELAGAAGAERERYGEPRPVLVAARAMPAGHRLAEADATVRDLPSAAVPSGALRGHARGAVLAVPVGAGEVLTATKLAPAGLGPVAGLLPPGTRGLAVPDTGGLRLAPGDAVDVFATFPPEAAAGDEPTFAVARDAAVVDVAAHAVTVAVREADAARVAFALTQGVVTLALSAGR